MTVGKRMNQIRSRFSQIIRKGIFLLVSAFCLIALSYAWFNFHKDGETDEIEFVSIKSVGFEASVDGEHYYDMLDLEIPDNLHLSPVSGDGSIGGMYAPVLLPGSDTPIMSLAAGSHDTLTQWVPVEYDEEAADNSFYRVHVLFRADVAGYVTLSQIAVNPLAAPEKRQKADYTDADGNAVEVSGTVDRAFEGSLLMKLADDSQILTRDYMAAATRVSITNTGEAEAGIAKRFLVIPNAGFKMKMTETAEPGGEPTYRLEMQETHEVDTDRKWYHYYNGRRALYGERDFNYFYANQISDSLMQYVLRLKEDPSDGMFKGEIDICLWVEGFDEEACDVFADGRITMDMTFNYVESAPDK